MDMLFFLQDAASGAAGAAGQPPPASGPGDLLKMLPMFGMIFVVMYFLMIRPQGKLRKEREALLSGLKKHDHVVTASGIYGVIKQAKPDDPFVTLCIDERNDVCIRVTKESIAKLEGDAKAEPKADAQEKKS
ncbi:MAG TPA: preprotein translocase subunit YajC [Planctomycetota bacterium]|nr:preprotein translocase subunit YajC [Planctomycetota bacterium]